MTDSSLLGPDKMENKQELHLTPTWINISKPSGEGGNTKLESSRETPG